MQHSLKRILAAALSVLMLAGGGAALMTQLPSAVVCAATVTIGNGTYSYTVKSDNTVEITGYTGEDRKLTIPSEIDGREVTAISDHAFQNCGYIENLTIPASITSISHDSFLFDYNLSKIVVDPENPRYDSRNNCNAIIETDTNTLVVGCVYTVIPESVTSIGPTAFTSFSKYHEVGSIEIPGSVTSIGEGAFNCSGIKRIEIPESVTTIEESTFSNSDLEEITLPNSLTTIKVSAFMNCKLTEIELPENLTSIQHFAFSGCKNINSVVIPYGIKKIENNTFADCTGLKSIAIPNSVESIDFYAFENSGLTDVYFYGTEADWEAIDIHQTNTILLNGGATIHFENSTPVTEDMITLSPDTYTYDGTAKTPAVTVKDGEQTLTANVDYIVSYSDNLGAGTGIVTVKGKGKYKGSAVKPFEIRPKALSACTVGDIGNYAYTGSAIVPGVIVLDGDTVLKKDTDYTVACSNNVQAGKATMTVTGKGNYTGSVQRDFLITNEAEMITAGTVTLSSASVIYTGSAQEPPVTVTLDAKTLKSGTDYDVSYSNNTDAGTAEVTVTGKGNYAGTLKKTFTIHPRAMDSVNASLPKSVYLYTGSALTPAVTVKDGKKTLTKGTDYTVSYSNNVKVGTASVTLSGKGNYSGTLKKTFAVRKDFAGTSASLPKSVYLYTGSALTPTVTVKDGSKTLTKGTDYTVSYSNNVKVGNASLTLAGKGNYSGTLKKTFAIKKNFAKTNAALSAASFVYNGKAKTPAVTVKDGAKTLTKGTDYTVAYANNTNVGTATATITGKGSYTGTLKKTYKIVPAKPPAPAAANTASGIKVTWKKPAGAGGYFIYRSKGTGAFAKVKTVSSAGVLTWADTGTTNGAKYRYKIAAFKTVGGKTYTGAFSPVKTCYRLDRPSLSLGNISGGIQLTVGKNGSASGYQFCISTKKDFSKSLTVDFSKTTLRLNVSNEIGKTCYLKVRAVKTVSGTKYYSEWSSVKSITVKN